jgi:hypothetical protein
VREYGGDISIVMNETDHRTNNYSVTEIILPPPAISVLSHSVFFFFSDSLTIWY